MEQLKDDGVSIAFGDVGDGFGLYLFDKNGKLILPKRFEQTPRAELVKQFSKEYTKLKEENERVFRRTHG